MGDISRPYTIGDTKEAIEKRDEAYDRIFGRKVKTSSGEQYRVFIEDGVIVNIKRRSGVEGNIPTKERKEIIELCKE